ncbi:MAG: class I SAM-dependent DNA methyltransferase, partial [Bacteroidales bacterium]|nr:class I SAM-dependent DNA methyltransferase [Bacteroidales bacterium]
MNGQIRILKPRKALNKAFLKVKPNRTEIECFKTNLSQLLDRINDNESEEFHKNLLSDFLKKTYYEPNHFINTKGRNDLVIHNTNSASGTVGVIIEAKKPANKTEMMKAPSPGDTQSQMLSRINVKAFQELVLYYLRERVTNKNIEIKHLIATNINEWFIFDAMLFERLFAQNKNLVKQFNDFESGRLADTKTDFFYKQVAEPFIAEMKHEIEFTYFNIQEYEKPLRNTDKQDDNQLIALFKLLSPEHLLKLPFANDSNSLDKRFYGELLHIIGLTETKEGGKKLIERNKEGERHTGSFIENAIIQIDSLDKISRLENANQFGANLQERLFGVALELSITWINRILFLKLLEAQLISYHKGDKSYGFLSNDKIKDYDDLNSLFFQVLARKQNERNEDVRAVFSKVPYLNSSLFEPTDIEHATIFISNLRDDRTIPIYPQTVLKDSIGKKRTGIINPLEYLFEFLNAYDFTSEGSEEIQEDNKTLINASVLGLIFEKINGYKDGSFFTPGFITMYMCRETIRKAVVQKFNEKKAWNCTDIKSLYDKIEDRNEANSIINDLKICDPAVGSGHFLVSALNEIIAIKSELGILMDIDGRLLRDIQIEVVNDELQVIDIEDDELFFYLAPAPRKELTTRNKFNGDTHNVKPEKIPYRQLIQQSLFKEKQFIIENCLFGV